MNVNVTLNHDVPRPSATVRLAGDLDYLTTPSAVAAVRRVVDEHPTLAALHLDCAGLTFCDSAGLAGLLEIHAHVQSGGVRLHLDARPAYLDRLLDITGVLEYLTNSAHDDVDPASDDTEETELG